MKIYNSASRSQLERRWGQKQNNPAATDDSPSSCSLKTLCAYTYYSFSFFFLFLSGFGLQVFNLKADLIVVSGVFCHNGCVRFSESAGGASWHFAVTSAGCCRNESPCGTKSLPEKKFAYLRDSSRQKILKPIFPIGHSLWTNIASLLVFANIGSSLAVC